MKRSGEWDDKRHVLHALTVEARKVEHDHPPTPKPMFSYFQVLPIQILAEQAPQIR